MNQRGLRRRVVFVSMIEDVGDSRVTKIRQVVQDLGYDVVTVMPGERAEGDGRHIELKRPTRLFFPNAGAANVLLAAGGRVPRFCRGLAAVWRQRPDICHCHEPDSWLIGVIMKAVFGSKVVVDLHEIYEAKAVAFPRILQGLIHQMIRGGMWWLSRYTDLVLHVSVSRRDHHRYLHGLSHVVGNYPTVKHLESLGPAAGQQSDRFVLVHAGSLRFSYAAGELLAAVEQAAETVDGLQLLVIGGVRGSLGEHEELRIRLEERGILRILPQVAHEAVFSYLCQADAGVTLVLPVDINHRLAVPRKMYEYLAAGLPVIGSAAPDVIRTVDAWDCGLYVHATEPSPVAEAIVMLASDSEARARMSRNARRAAEEKLNWEIERRRLREVYGSLGALVDA